MDPVIVAGGFAVLFALVALMLWRRAADLEEQVRLLEAKLADRAPAKEPAAAPEKEPEEATAEDEQDEDERAEAEEPDEEEEEDEASDDEGEGEDDDEDEDEELAAAAPAPPTEEAVAPPPEPAVAEPEPAEPEPAAAALPEPAPPPKAPEPDPLRLAALKIVSDAFELARYLDFDAIVEKPSTYRVTVPITAANGNAVRFLEDKMFTCLAQVRIEDDSAILHIDTGKGPP
jgi:cytoskeletal protein RodZ